MKMTLELAIQMGGNEWQKDEKHRVYFNSVQARMKLYNIECSFYKTGNISSASMNGEHISNSKAYKYLDAITVPYYDVVADKMVGMIE